MNARCSCSCYVVKLCKANTRGVTDGAGAGVLFVSPSKEQLRYVLRIHFPASNNAAEYEACLHGLRIAVELGVKRLYVYGDLALVINQLNKD